MPAHQTICRNKKINKKKETVLLLAFGISASYEVVLLCVLSSGLFPAVVPFPCFSCIFYDSFGTTAFIRIHALILVVRCESVSIIHRHP